MGLIWFCGEGFSDYFSFLVFWCCFVVIYKGFSLHCLSFGLFGCSIVQLGALMVPSLDHLKRVGASLAPFLLA